MIRISSPDDDGARVFDILSAFLLPDVFSILAQTIRSSLSDFPIQKRERHRFLQPRGRNILRYATNCVELLVCGKSRDRNCWQRKFEISRVLDFLNCNNKFLVGIHRLKFYNYVFKKRKSKH